LTDLTIRVDNITEPQFEDDLEYHQVSKPYQ